MPSGLDRVVDAARGAPATGVVAITPADSDLAISIRSFFVGGAGNVQVTAIDGTTATLTGVPAGVIIPIECKRIWATSTTATNITGLL